LIIKGKQNYFFKKDKLAMGKDYYTILNVDKNADEEALKKAYRKLGKF